MGDDHARHLPFLNDAENEFFDCAHRVFIQRRGRLISKQDLGSIRQRSRKCDPLGFAAGKIADVALRKFGQADAIQERFDPLRRQDFAALLGPNAMFEETVPGNRWAVCMTMPTRRRRSCGAMER